MEHPLFEVSIVYTITQDLQYAERSQQLRRQILMPDGLEIQGENLLLHLLGPDCKIKNFELYQHALATRVSKLNISKVDPKQKFDLKSLFQSTFIIIAPQEYFSNAKARADATLLHENQCSQLAGVAICHNKAESTPPPAHPDLAVTQPQKKAEVVKNTVAEVTSTYTPHIEHINVNQFVTSLYNAASIPSLDPNLHCTMRGRCSICIAHHAPVVNTGCGCSICIYCALFRAACDGSDPRYICHCRKNILPFSQWIGLSDDMKSAIRQFAKKSQTDPLVHSQFNDFVDVLGH